MRAVERMKSGRYRVRFRYGTSDKTGRPRQCSETFNVKKDADQFALWLDAYGPKVALDKLWAGEQEGAVPSVNKIAADHIELLPNIEAGTRLSYSRLWARTWGPLIGDLPAHHVDSDLLKRAVITLGKTYSEKSLKNQRGLLASVLDRAVELGHLPSNPTKNLKLPRGKEQDRTEMRILTNDEFADVLEGIRPHYRPLVMFLYGTGARWGEAVALTVADVQPPNVRIRRALKWSPDNQRTVGATKTRRSNRTVALPQEVIDVLDLDRPGDALLFTAPRGGPVHHRTFWSDIWLPAVNHLKPRPRIHDLRHSHASWLLGKGVPLHVVQARLGHESIQTTVDTYTHLLPDAQLAASLAAGMAFSRPALEG
jgi:integrase